MTIGDLIKDKDYDYISYRATAPIGWGVEDVFIGVCKSENGKLISLDGDTYYESEEVIAWEEWSKEDIPRGLTVVIEKEWEW